MPSFEMRIFWKSMSWTVQCTLHGGKWAEGKRSQKELSRCSLPAIVLGKSTESCQCVSGTLITWCEGWPSVPQDTATLHLNYSVWPVPASLVNNTGRPAGAWALDILGGGCSVEGIQKDSPVVLSWNQLSGAPIPSLRHAKLVSYSIAYSETLPCHFVI